MLGKKTAKNIKILMITDCLRTINNIFMETFLLAFIFKYTKHNATDVGIYHFMTYLAVLIVAYLSGNWLKRGNRILMYQVGVILTCTYMLIFMFFKENIVHFLPLCGLIFGTKIALRAFPFNLIVADNVGQDRLIAFKGYVEGLKGILRIVVPIVLGTLFTYGSHFGTVAALTVLCFVELFVFSFIKARPRKNASRFSIPVYWRRAKGIKCIKELYWLEICRGMTIDGTLGTLVVLYIVYLFKTDFNLGMITSAFFVVTIIIHFLFGRFGRYHYFSRILLMTAGAMVLAVILFLLLPNKETFILYNFCFTVVVQILGSIIDINMFNISNQPVVTRYKCEYFAVREMFLNMGRLVSYTLLIVAGLWSNFLLIKYLLVFLTVVLVVMCTICIKLNRELNENHS